MGADENGGGKFFFLESSWKLRRTKMEWNSCSYIPSLRSELDGSKFCSILSDHYHRRQNCCYRCHHHLMPAQLWCPKKVKERETLSVRVHSVHCGSSSLDPHFSFAVGCRGAEKVHFAPRLSLSLSVRVHIRDRECSGGGAQSIGSKAAAGAISLSLSLCLCFDEGKCEHSSSSSSGIAQ